MQSPSDLVKEITALEFEIVRMERYLLSLYRTSFQQTLPSNLGSHGNHIQQMAGGNQWATPDQSSQRKKSFMAKGCYEFQGCNSPTTPSDLLQFDTPKSSSARVIFLASYLI